MQFLLILVTTATASINALMFPDLRDLSTSSVEIIRSAFPSIETRTSDKCPAVWKNIIADFSKLFLGDDGQCNDDARAAIRESFHDCGTWTKSLGSTGGCDGSLILANEVSTRRENNGLQGYSTKVQAMKTKYPDVTIADLIVVGSSVAIVTCPGGPRIDTYVGRKDSSVPAQTGTLPSPFADGETLYQMFKDKDFDDKDLAALMGAHSVSKAFETPNITSGASQDTTPGKWDVNYYAETFKAKSGMTAFPSDVNLAAHKKVGDEMKKLVDNKSKWDDNFKDAMEKMHLLGNKKGDLIECTDFVPKGTNNKREMRGSPINARIR